MATEFTMPKLGEVMEEGTVVVWKKKVGEQVSKGEVLMEIQTDKVAINVESPASGTLLKILVPANTTVPINTVLALIGEPCETS